MGLRLGCGEERRGGFTQGVQLVSVDVATVSDGFVGAGRRSWDSPVCLPEQSVLRCEPCSRWPIQVIPSRGIARLGGIGHAVEGFVTLLDIRIADFVDVCFA